MDLFNETSSIINTPSQFFFAWSDYLIFGSLLGVSLSIGVFFGFWSKQDSAAEYLFGGKHMGYLPVAISTIASSLSGISLLGTPSEVYLHGAQYILTTITNILVTTISAVVFMPVFYKLQLASTYEYLELRFSRRIRSFASIMYIIALMMYIPIVVYVPAIAFAQVTGYNLHFITPLLSLVCITYTTMGGVKAVIWTDTIQFIFTIGGLFTVLTLGIISSGGFSEVWKIAKAGGRLDVVNLTPDPFVRTSFWGFTVGLTFTWLSSFGVGQKFVQRFLSIEKEKDITKALIIVLIGSITVNFACTAAGLIMYAKYHDCDLVSAKVVERYDQILPYYVMDVAGKIPGLPGIFLAGIVSSALSTMSASLNTLSGTIYEDFIDKWIPESPKKDATSANIMKVISVLIGLITIGLIFIIEHLGTIFEMAISLRSAVEGPLLGVFILGVMVPAVGEKGAFYGGVASLIIMTWLVVGTKWHVINNRIQYPHLPMSTESCPQFSNQTVNVTAPPPLLLDEDDEPLIFFRISMMYLVLIGTFICMIVACITSYLTKEWNKKKINPDYLSPFIRGFYAEKKYVEVAMYEIPVKSEKK